MSATLHSPLSTAPDNSDLADTNIYVTPGAPRSYVPAPVPNFTPIPQTHPAYAPPATTTHTVVESKPHSSINWGGVAKGVAIVAAVAVAGVAVYAAGAAIAGWAMASPAISAAAATVASAVEPAVALATEGGAWLSGFIGHIIPATGSFIGGLFGAGEVALTAAQTTAATSTIGAVTAGGAIAVAAPHAFSALEHTNLIDHHTTEQVVATTTTPEVNTPAQHSYAAADIASDLASLDAAAVGAQQSMHPNTHLGHPDATHLHSAEHDVHMAYDVGHHARHTMEHYSHAARASAAAPAATPSSAYVPEDATLADTDTDHAQRIARRSWKDALAAGGTNDYMSHAEAVQARRGSAPVIAPRNGFANSVDAERLEAAANGTQIA